MNSTKRIPHIATILAVGCMMLAACREVPVVEVEGTSDDQLKESLINANRYVIANEETRINAYVERRGWDMVQLASGARVMKTGYGSDRAVEHGDTLAITYTVEDLGGSIIYPKQSDTVVAGRLKPTRGLDAALQTLHYGDRARVVVPSEQGYGVAGDGERIGSRTILVYDVEVTSMVKIKQK